MRVNCRWLGVFLSAVLLGSATGLLLSLEALAKKEFFEAARKKYGKQIKGCKHCHVKLLPSEESHELNPRGRWLLAQKNKRKAETVNVEWLKDYPEPDDTSTPPSRRQPPDGLR